MSAFSSGTAGTGFAPAGRQRDEILVAAAALARHIELDRVFQELAQQMRHLVPFDSLALALIPDDVAAPRLVFHDGFDSEGGIADPTAIAQRLSAGWQEALASGHVVTRRAAGGTELVAPLSSARGPLGVLTVLAEDVGPTYRPDEAERTLAALAELVAAAVERSRLVGRASERRRLEAIGQVTSGVAHELRTPLFGISSAAQLLRFRSREDPVVERNVGRILREVERLNSLTADLLEVGRSRPLSIELGEPDAVWDRVLEGYRGQLESRSLIVKRTRAPGHPKVPIDAEQLAQAFIHLLENATETAPPATDLALVSTILPSGSWRSTLHNAGPPIAPDALPRVFELFFSTKQGSTGVGLAISQRIVHEHGGMIGIESSEAGGTVVAVTLPAAGG